MWGVRLDADFSCGRRWHFRMVSLNSCKKVSEDGKTWLTQVSHGRTIVIVTPPRTLNPGRGWLSGDVSYGRRGDDNMGGSKVRKRRKSRVDALAEHVWNFGKRVLTIYDLVLLHDIFHVISSIFSLNLSGKVSMSTGCRMLLAFDGETQTCG